MGDTCDLGREGSELESAWVSVPSFRLSDKFPISWRGTHSVDHGVDGVDETQDFSVGLDRDLLTEVSSSDGGLRNIIVSRNLDEEARGGRTVALAIDRT